MANVAVRKDGAATTALRRNVDLFQMAQGVVQDLRRRSASVTRAGEASTAMVSATELKQSIFLTNTSL